MEHAHQPRDKKSTDWLLRTRTKPTTNHPAICPRFRRLNQTQPTLLGGTSGSHSDSHTRNRPSRRIPSGGHEIRASACSPRRTNHRNLSKNARQNYTHRKSRQTTRRLLRRSKPTRPSSRQSRLAYVERDRQTGQHQRQSTTKRHSDATLPL